MAAVEVSVLSVFAGARRAPREIGEKKLRLNRITKE